MTSRESSKIRHFSLLYPYRFGQLNDPCFVHSLALSRLSRCYIISKMIFAMLSATLALDRSEEAAFNRAVIAMLPAVAQSTRALDPAAISFTRSRAMMRHSPLGSLVSFTHVSALCEDWYFRCVCVLYVWGPPGLSMFWLSWISGNFGVFFRS